MSDNVLNILFLGERPSWLKLSQAILEAPDVPLRVHRAQSPSDAFRMLYARKWDALTIDLHAWSFQGLLSLQKIPSEYPAMALIAPVYPTVKELEKRAVQAGASRCLSLDKLTARELHAAIVSIIIEKKAEFQNQKGQEMQLERALSGEDPLHRSKVELVSHALNNLLCVISAYADILADQVPGPEPAVRSINEIKKAAKSASDLMRHLK